GLTPPPASPKTSFWRSSPPTTASRTGSTSSRRNGACVRRGAAGRQISRYRPGDERQDELTRPSHRPRHAQSDDGVDAGQLRQGRRVLLLDIERRRRPRGSCEPDPEVRRRREYV